MLDQTRAEARASDLTKPPLKVAIVGTAPTSRAQAPFNDLSWEIWGQAQPNLPRWTRWFELHDLDMIAKTYGELWGFLTQADGVLYTAKADPRVKGIVYPRDAMIAKFGAYFFTSTVAWEMALAISEGASEIALYGIEMASDEEYAAQKPGCQHFVALARQAGIKVTVPAGCELLNPQPLYALGESDWRAKNVAARKAALIVERDKEMREIDASTERLNRLLGAIEALEFFEQNWL